jgi:UDP-glucose 4-epimerase
VKLDVCDDAGLRDVFSREKFDAVLHFAGLKAVGESVRKPILCYRNNLISSMTLCQVMEGFGVRRLVFSSSATVYGTASVAPFIESAALGPTNPLWT